MFKLGMAIVFAVIASSVAIIAGLASGARVGTVCLRALLVFVVSTGAVFLVTDSLERFGVIHWVRKSDLPTEDEGEAMTEDSAEQEDQMQEETAAEQSAEEVPEEGGSEFAPLETDGLKHISAPQD